MFSALVSIIIPVYNLENYIENCLNSLMNQTYENLEIICVDDGSRDRSADIIKKLASKDERIVYVYQDNAGVSAARNNGLDKAHGEYIMFADGDDYMHYQAVEILVGCIEEKQCNMVFSGSVVTPNTSEKMERITLFNTVPIVENTLFDDSTDRAVWGKIFRKDILDGFRFPVGITNAEDFNFMLRLLYSCRNNAGYRIDCVLYYYYLRENSASFHAFSPKNITEIYVNEQNAEYFSDKDDCYLKDFSRLCLLKAMLFVRTKSIGSAYEKETKTAVSDAWKKWRKVFWESSGISKKDKLMFTAFYYSRHLYEIARLIQDPTMKDFYKSRKTEKELEK